jgi:hypothetical protein
MRTEPFTPVSSSSRAVVSLTVAILVMILFGMVILRG